MEPIAAAATAGTDFVAIVATWQNVATIVGAMFLVGMTKRMFPGWSKTPLAKRLLTGAPAFWCSAAVWLPGHQPDDATITHYILVGLALGAACYNLHAVARKFGMDWLADMLEQRKGAA